MSSTKCIKNFRELKYRTEINYQIYNLEQTKEKRKKKKKQEIRYLSKLLIYMRVNHYNFKVSDTRRPSSSRTSLINQARTSPQSISAGTSKFTSPSILTQKRGKFLSPSPRVYKDFSGSIKVGSYAPNLHNSISPPLLHFLRCIYLLCTRGAAAV